MGIGEIAGIVRESPSIDWRIQIDAIKQLASKGYCIDAEETGKFLLDHMEGERTPLLELLGEICIQEKRYRQAADYYLQAQKEAAQETEANRYLVIAADAYYRNGDYDLAAAIYWERHRREADDE
ncbi:MAG: hypothetical protein LBB11_03965, partial [Puniceicoccales bacterium]|nr:hypothetical protein [Puniceicoccales bacterium]